MNNEHPPPSYQLSLWMTPSCPVILINYAFKLRLLGFSTSSCGPQTCGFYTRRPPGSLALDLNSLKQPQSNSQPNLSSTIQDSLRQCMGAASRPHLLHNTNEMKKSRIITLLTWDDTFSLLYHYYHELLLHVLPNHWISPYSFYIHLNV